MTVAADLDRVQQYLHDDGRLWAREELLAWYRQGYVELLAATSTVRRWRPLDVPGRATYSVTYEWEDRHTGRGTIRKLVHPSRGGHEQSHTQWEQETLAGVGPTVSLTGITQEWERAYVQGADPHFRFPFPRNHQRVVRLEWKNEVLKPVSVRELDESDVAWMSQVGEPSWWTTGTGRVRTVELYEITPTYRQAYRLIDPDNGLPRGFSGERTWAAEPADRLENAWAYTTAGDADAIQHSRIAPLGLGYRLTLQNDARTAWATQPWEIDLLDGAVDTEPDDLVFAVGAIRRVTSPDRQYLPVESDAQTVPFAGRVSDWRSSEDSLLALEVVLPDVNLTEDDTPAFIPSAMRKYLRYYVLSRAFGRPGEGRIAILAEHYARRFGAGVTFFKGLADLARKDRTYQRDGEAVPSGTVPRVRLPSNFPRAM